MADSDLRQRLLAGHVIPAHPLALTPDRKLDQRHQSALTRYYRDAGAGGIAVGVHTTQFAIREAGLYPAVLRMAAAESAGMIRIAGICGNMTQAVQEAQLAAGAGYHAGLLSLVGVAGDRILHARTVSRELPIFGFYLQPAVGGPPLHYEFWRAFFDIPGVVAVKVAPFNRYATVEVARALVDCGRAHEIAMYTGNDDAILTDLATEFCFPNGSVRFAGGLLGQWAVWTSRAVGMFRTPSIGPAAALTDANGALFDVRNGFRGCIPGIHEILVRQGLLAGRWCLDPKEDLSPGQMEEINRVCAAYPFLQDDEFVARNLPCWLQ